MLEGKQMMPETSFFEREMAAGEIAALFHCCCVGVAILGHGVRVVQEAKLVLA